MKENNWSLIPWFVTKYNKDLLSLQEILSEDEIFFLSGEQDYHLFLLYWEKIDSLLTANHNGLM